MTTSKIVKKIPYGISDYKRIRDDNYYYVDKSQYIKEVEDCGSFIFFIRPRRFGKSSFLSMLSSYYDVRHKDEFDSLFGGTWIYDHPTSERAKYLILSFNFSILDPSLSKLETSFLTHVKNKVRSFLTTYQEQLPNNFDIIKNNIEESQSPADVLALVIDLCNESKRDLYVIIDEYDNFANTLLSTSGTSAYLNTTHGEGFLRSFFNVLKGGTTGTSAPIKRLFITGVSPITMDDVTSGFNIGRQISLFPQFNQMLGFTRQDIIDILQYYTNAGLINSNFDTILELMDQWYGNYLFSKSETTKMYNTDMVLYFIDNYLMSKKIPIEMIDRNVRIDYGKLKHLILIDKKGEPRPTTNGNFNKLKQIMENGEILSELVSGFPLEEVTDSNHFCSLLFYLGLLTLKDAEDILVRLAIPNETVKHLFYDYIKSAYKETGVFSIDTFTFTQLMGDMAKKGEWQPLLQYIITLMDESMSLRDLITGEKSIQAFLNVYLGLSQYYEIYSEREFNKGYGDLYLEPAITRFPDLSYAYLLEIKYMPVEKKLSKPKLKQVIKEAEAQVKQYSLDTKFQKVLDKTTLIKLVLIFSGSHLLYMGKVTD